ncbi:MAG: hypothetical protein AAGF84_04295 [Planctomycetota bacterium]
MPATPVSLSRLRFDPASPLAVLVAALMLFAASTDAQDAPPEPPYTGVIAVDSVEARGSAGRVFYPVAELKKGDRVIVEDDDYFTWFRIQAPTSVRAHISQADVEAGGDGSRGVVTSDIAQVRVMGLDRTAEDSFKTLISLTKGDAVTILDRDDKRFIIEAPKGTTVFLPPGSVEPLQNQPEFDAEEDTPTPAPAPAPTPVVETPEIATDTPAPEAVTVGSAGDMVPLDAEVEADTSETPETQVTDVTAEVEADTDLPPLVVPPPLPTPADDADTPLVGDTPAADDGEPSETPADATTEAPAPKPVETLAVNEALRAVELEMLPQFELPVEQQPLDQIEAAYSQVAAEQELTGVDARIVENRLAAVSRNRQFAAALAQIEQRQSAVPTLEPLAIEPDADEPYAAVGVMSVSTVLSEQGGKVFRVVDPATRRTIAYVQPAVGVDPALSLGEIVGVRGQRQYDPSLNAQLIIAQQVKVLAAD